MNAVVAREAARQYADRGILLYAVDSGMSLLSQSLAEAYSCHLIGSVKTELQRHATPMERIFLVSKPYSICALAASSDRPITGFHSSPRLVRGSHSALGWHYVRDNPVQRRGRTLGVCWYRPTLTMLCSGLFRMHGGGNARKRCTTRKLVHDCGVTYQNKCKTNSQDSQRPASS
jgi:hypothetical protein